MKRNIFIVGTFLLPLASGRRIVDTPKMKMNSLRVRGGVVASSSADSEEAVVLDFEAESAQKDTLAESSTLETDIDVEYPTGDSVMHDECNPPPLNIKQRRTTAFLVDLSTRSGVGLNRESLELRKLISERKTRYLEELETDFSAAGTPNESLLQCLTPKIPAIKHMPEISLRVQSRKSGIDPGIAASLIGAIAHADHVYRHPGGDLANGQDVQRKPHRRLFGRSDSNLVDERRFEQLVECALCGINVRLRTEEYEQLEEDGVVDCETNVEELVADEETQTSYTPGLTIRDACRMAWGLAVLGVHDRQKFAGEEVHDVFIALSLRVRELLLARLEMLTHDDLSSDFGDDSMAALSLDDRIFARSEELAEDVATAMWAFGCVTSCTGFRSVPLFEVCSSLLSQDPLDLRRRAQEDLTPSTSVGTSDVVDRLEMAEDELDNDQSSPEAQSSKTLGQKQSLLDWLSPQEMVDVLWSMALHDSKEKDEVTLSENAGTLRELAVDRIMGLVVSELQRLKEEEMKPVEDVEKDEIVGDSEMPVAETITIEIGSEGEEVDVIDASAILAASSGSHSSLQLDENVAAEDVAESEEVEEIIIHEGNQNAKRLSIFTARDLCSLVWAATELRDSLVHQLVNYVAEIFDMLGDQSVMSLSPGDLTNLAWALAKVGPSDHITNLGVSIASSALALIESKEADSESYDDVLEHFQPPELSRLLWAITSIHEASFLVSQGAPRQLSALALSSASVNRQLFGAEDLGRILWSFLDLHQYESDGPSTQQIVDIGVVLATIETSLLFWESMTTNNVRHMENESTGMKESVRFASFFGRTRFSFPLLDNTKDEYTQDEADEFSLPSKSKLPLLSDIPVDPSTLCKLASTLHLYSGKMETMKDISSIAKVTIRLLASRSGRLLRACPVPDLARLCRTIASSDANVGRETVGLFARRLLRLLNEDSDILRAATDEDRATMIFSLGELGAKSSPTDEDVSLAYRRLHWTDPSHFFERGELSRISDDALLMTLTGIVNLNVVAWNESPLKCCLSVVVDRCETFSDPCSLATAVALAKSNLPSQDETVIINLENKNKEENQSESDAGMSCKVSSENSQSDGATCFQLCDNALLIIADRLEQDVSSMSLSQIRQVLEGYSLGAIQCDNLMERIRQELELRRTWLDDVHGANFAELVRYAKSMSSRARSSLFGDGPSDGGPVDSIRKKVSSFFGSSTETETEGNDEEQSLEDLNEPHDLNETEELQVQLEAAFQSILSIADCTDLLEQSSQVDLGKSCRRVCDGALFELGRCLELVALYERIDFQTGTRATRFDHHSRRNIAKDMLTRLVPDSSE